MKTTHNSKLKTFSLDEPTINDLKQLSESMNIKQSTLIKLLILEAKKNENLRRMLKRDLTQLLVEEFIIKNNLPWEKTKILIYTELLKKKKNKKANNQASQQDDTEHHEEVSDEEIAQLIASLDDLSSPRSTRGL